MEQLVRLMPIVLPPLLGAVIGYVTNALAIRMLFRPLSEKRFLGVRIPFTPGILPRQRHQLAQSIATMVSSRLLTRDVLLDKIKEAEFKETLRGSVSRLTDDVLSGRHGGEAPSDAAAIIDDLLASFLSSESFIQTMKRVAGDVVGGLFSLDAARLIPSDEQLSRMTAHVIRTIGSDELFARVAKEVDTRLAGYIESDTPVQDLVGRSLVFRVLQLVPGLYGPAFDLLVTFLRQARTRQELSVHGRGLLKQVLSRLNVVQRFLVSAAQYDRNLNDNMPAVVSDVIASVELAGSTQHNRRRIVRSVQHRVAALSAKGIATLEHEFSIDARSTATHAMQTLRRLIARPEVVSVASGVLHSFADRWRADSVGRILESATGIGEDAIRRKVVDAVERWLSDESHRAELAERAAGIVRSISRTDTPDGLRRLLPMTPAQKGRVDDYLTGRVLEQIERRVPELLDGLDIHTMVAKKIDGLDMASVEQLLLLVIARHLKWINLFGAMLGALIGGSQVLLRFFV